MKTAVPSRTPTLADREDAPGLSEGYRQGNELFARLAGLEYDSSCKNPERISGTAYDPDAYHAGKPCRSRSSCRLPSLRETGSAERTEGETGTLYRNGGQGGRGVRKRLRTKESAMSRGHHNEYVSAQPATSSTSMACRRRRPSDWAVEAFADYGAENVESTFRSCYAERRSMARAPAPERWRQRQTGGRRGEQAGRGGGDRGVPVFAGGVPPQMSSRTIAESAGRRRPASCR
ncbi:MAG: BT4734/BF3469 family protein [Parabacteroides merdae]